MTNSDYTEKLREYEKAHAKYMQTSVFAPDAETVKKNLKEKEAAYVKAVKEANPEWVVF